MANKNKKTGEVLLDDERKLRLRPLKIFYLKKTIAELNELNAVPDENEDENEETEPFFNEINAAASAAYEALQQDNDDVVVDVEWVLGNLDMEDVQHVLQICAGYDTDEEK